MMCEREVVTLVNSIIDQDKSDTFLLSAVMVKLNEFSYAKIDRKLKSLFFFLNP